MALVGPDAAGKTTLALAFAARLGALISGDRTWLMDGEETLAVGFPMALRVGHGALAALGYQERVGSASFVRAQEAPLGSDRPMTFGSPLKLELSPAEVSSVLQVATTCAGRLAAVVLLGGRP